MRTLLKGLLLSCTLMAVTGCASAVGHWQMDSITPESAKGEFQLGMLCLAKDGTYKACAQEGGQVKHYTGTYKYDQAAKTLTFKGAAGKERTYNTELTGSQMKVWGGEEGKEWTAIMKREKCRCGKPCDPKKCPPPKCDKHKTKTKPAEPTS